MQASSWRGRPEDGLPEVCWEDAAADGQPRVNVLQHSLFYSLHVELFTRVQVQPDETTELSTRWGTV